MELAAVVFDMDGLMLETEALYKASWQRAAIALGYELDDEFYLTLVGRANSECEVALLARFETVVTGDTVSQGKPAPDIYLEAARRLGAVPTDCIALEDSDAGVMSASQAGMLALMIPDLKPPSREAARAAFRVLGSLYDARRVIGSLLGATDEAG